MLSSCLPLVSQMWFQNCLPTAFEAFGNSHLFRRIGLPTISACLPFVAPLFPNCLSDVVSICHLVVSCLSCQCDLLVVSKLVPDMLSRCFPRCLPLAPPLERPVVFQILSPNCAVLCATTACTFCASQLAKVLPACAAFSILTSRCALRHNSVLFEHLNFQRSSEPAVLCAF